MPDSTSLKKLVQEKGIPFYTGSEAKIDLDRGYRLPSVGDLESYVQGAGGVGPKKLFRGMFFSSAVLGDMTDDEILYFKSNFDVKPYSYSVSICGRGCCRVNVGMAQKDIDCDQKHFLINTRKNGLLISAGDIAPPSLPENVKKSIKTSEVISTAAMVIGLVGGAVGCALSLYLWMPLALVASIGAFTGLVEMSSIASDKGTDYLKKFLPKDKISRDINAKIDDLQQGGVSITRESVLGRSSAISLMVLQLTQAFKGPSKDMQATDAHVKRHCLQL